MARKAVLTVEIPHLTKRNGYWHFQRRVPREVAALDPRTFARKPTGVAVDADPNAERAGAIAARFNAEQEQDWADLLAGRNPAERQRAARAIETANVIGITYRPAADVAALDVPSILARTETLDREQARQATGKAASAPAALALIDATLGGVARSGILVSGLLEAFFPIVAANHRKKSPDQLRKYKNRRKAATSNFVTVNGDMDILSITKAHAVAFHAWWSKRLIDENMVADSANKDIWNLRNMIATVCKHHGLGHTDVFGGMAFKKEKNKRRAFTAKWVLENLWPADALATANEEVRDITTVLIETGARPGEICGLNQHTIFLDANIPFIRIKPDMQEIKTGAAERDIPLVGRALEVMRRYPNGFRRYYLKPNSYCGLINKHLAKLQPVIPHGEKVKTVYCLRHLFKDRLRHARVEDEMKLALMGHEHDADNPDVSNAPDYGEGFELQHKLDTLLKIAFPTA